MGSYALVPGSSDFSYICYKISIRCTYQPDTNDKCNPWLAGDAQPDAQVGKHLRRAEDEDRPARHESER